MMKKAVLFSIAMLMSVATFAQKKGDLYVGGSFSTEFGGYTMSTSLDDYATSEKASVGVSSEIGAEFAYFVANNTRLGLEVYFPFSSSPTEKVDGKWLKTKDKALVIVPSVAYYVKLADRFYYTPEIGILSHWNTSKTPTSPSTTETLSDFSWGGYINLLAFEFQASERIAIGVTAGGIGAFTSIYAYKGDDVKYKMNQITCEFNNACLHFRWYL